jgi:hypothetical protein
MQKAQREERLNMLRYAIPLSLLILIAHVAFATASESDAFRPRFYAFENGVRFGSFESEAQTLKQLGYDGISQVHTGGAKLAERIAAYDKVGIRPYSRSARQAPSSAVRVGEI